MLLRAHVGDVAPLTTGFSFMQTLTLNMNDCAQSFERLHAIVAYRFLAPTLNRNDCAQSLHLLRAIVAFIACNRCIYCAQSLHLSHHAASSWAHNFPNRRTYKPSELSGKLFLNEEDFFFFALQHLAD